MQGTHMPASGAKRRACAAMVSRIEGNEEKRDGRQGVTAS